MFGTEGGSGYVLVNSFLHLLLAAGGAYLFFRLQRTRRQLEALRREKDVIFGFVHDVGEVFAEAESIEPSLLLKRVLFYAMHTTKASSGAVYILEPDGEHLRASAVSGVFPPLTHRVESKLDAHVSRAKHIEEQVRTRLVARGEGLIGCVADLGAPLVIEDAGADDRVPKHDIDFLQVRTLALVPMRFHRRVLGVVVLANRVDGSPFSETDLNLLQALSDQASASIHYAGLRETIDQKKRIDHDLSVAREIQSALLPKEIPHIAGVEIAAFNDPAQEIGGDYYDVVPIDERHIGLAIADVSGKGVSGALLMSVCRSILRAHASAKTSPAAVLRIMNQILRRDISEDMFITMLYMVFDTERHELTVARAGHERPILMAADGAITPIDSPGTALGMLDPDAFDAIVADSTVRLKPGDVVVAYTDGITEAMNDQEQEWGVQSFLDAVRVAAPEGAHSVLNNVRQRLNRFVGKRPQYDDMTLLALRDLG